MIFHATMTEMMSSVPQSCPVSATTIEYLSIDSSTRGERFLEAAAGAVARRIREVARVRQSLSSSRRLMISLRSCRLASTQDVVPTEDGR